MFYTFCGSQQSAVPTVYGFTRNRRVNRVEHQIDDISKIGRYRYYRNSDGEVEYEKVSWYENIDFVFLYTD